MQLRFFCNYGIFNRFYRAAAATGAAYQAGQAGYAVAAPATAAAAAATYGTQRPAGYETAYQTAATPATYAAVGTGTTPGYEYGYGRAAATTGYDASKSYYQQTATAQAATGYSAAYDQTAAAAAKPASYAATYTQRAAAQPQAQAAVSLLFLFEFEGCFKNSLQNSTVTLQIQNALKFFKSNVNILICSCVQKLGKHFRQYTSLNTNKLRFFIYLYENYITIA